jgi:hypothetical protein
MEPQPRTSKTVAAWLALLLGTLGLHRVYLRGWGDPAAWLYAIVTGLGVWGVFRLNLLGQDDRLAWLLIPLLGFSISAAMLSAILYALTPDARWDERHNPGRQVSETGLGAVSAAILALLLGGGVLMATLAYGGEKFFEWQAAPSAAASVGTNPKA